MGQKRHRRDKVRDSGANQRNLRQAREFALKAKIAKALKVRPNQLYVRYL
jgi:hypothetical protein